MPIRSRKAGAALSIFESVKNQHSAYFAGFLHKRETALLGKGQKQVLADIDGEIENIRAAWDWATSQRRLDDIQNSLDSLAEYLDIRSTFKDAAIMLSMAAERLSQSFEEKENDYAKLLLARIQIQQGYFLSFQGDLEGSKVLILTALDFIERLGKSEDKAYALFYLAWFSYKWKEAQTYYEEALAIFREIGDPKGEARCLIGLAGVAVQTSDLEVNIQLCQKSLKIFQLLGNSRWIASTPAGCTRRGRTRASSASTSRPGTG